MRGSFFRAVGLFLLVLAASGAASSRAPSSTRPALTWLAVTNGDSPFSGDWRLLTTISPNGDGLRDRAEIHFRLREVATVTVVVSRTKKRLRPFLARRGRVRPGPHPARWGS